MKVEVLVSTMECQDYEQLYNKMNLQTDAIIINQTNDTLVGNLEKQIENSVIRGLSFQEKGIGLSRNNSLMRSNGDICLVADDDMVYVDNYFDILTSAYKKYPDADMIIFNVRIHQENKIFEKVKKNGRVRIWNSLKYGTVSFSFKRNKILKKRIFFSLLFGGGTKHGSGEDSLFLNDILRRKLKVYTDKNIIADVYNDGSSWFKGYNEKYFVDKGALYKALFTRSYPIFIIQFLLRHSYMHKETYGFFYTAKLMFKGAKKY